MSDINYSTVLENVALYTRLIPLSKPAKRRKYLRSFSAGDTARGEERGEGVGSPRTEEQFRISTGFDLLSGLATPSVVRRPSNLTGGNANDDGGRKAEDEREDGAQLELRDSDFEDMPWLIGSRRIPRVSELNNNNNKGSGRKRSIRGLSGGAAKSGAPVEHRSKRRKLVEEEEGWQNT